VVRKAQDRFPDIVESKQIVCDAIAPGNDLGHADRRPIAD
jgi:predicted Rdx family selenoprotein